MSLFSKKKKKLYPCQNPHHPYKVFREIKQNNNNKNPPKPMESMECIFKICHTSNYICVVILNISTDADTRLQLCLYLL